MAEQAAIGQDVIDFANVLGLERFVLAGFDWGNRTACITSILHPRRMRAQVVIGGCSVQNTVVPSVPGSAATEAWLWSSGPKSLLQNTLTGPDWSDDVQLYVVRRNWTIGRRFLETLPGEWPRDAAGSSFLASVAATFAV